MELKCIFVDELTGEGLYAMHYDGEVQDEYERLFDLWDDTEYVFEYIKANQEYLKSEYFEGANPDEITNKVLKEAIELDCLLEDHFYDEDKTLQMLFIPLNNHTTSIPHHQK